jgi:hypothetical protein
MKKIIISIIAVLMLLTANVKAGQNKSEVMQRKVSNLVVNALSSSTITENGKITLTFYVFEDKFVVKDVEGNNVKLNDEVKNYLNHYKFYQKGLNGRYNITVQMVKDF